MVSDEQKQTHSPAIQSIAQLNDKGKHSTKALNPATGVIFTLKIYLLCKSLCLSTIFTYQNLRLPFPSSFILLLFRHVVICEFDNNIVNKFLWHNSKYQIILFIFSFCPQAARTPSTPSKQSTISSHIDSLSKLLLAHLVCHSFSFG